MLKKMMMMIIIIMMGVAMESPLAHGAIPAITNKTTRMTMIFVAVNERMKSENDRLDE